jgi:hypothetical protein
VNQTPCENCQDLHPSYLPEPTQRLETTLVEVQRSRDAGCKFCHLLCETCAYYHQTNDVDRPNFRFQLMFYPRRPVVMERQMDRLISFPVIYLYAPKGACWLTCVLAFGGHFNSLFYVVYFFLANSLSDTIPAWRALGSQTDIHADPRSDECLALQRKWLRDCLANHEECRLETQSQTPRRLISIGANNMSLRVVETPVTAPPYVALSHCWGAKQPLITTTSILHLRQKNLNWDSMPATFQDAVRVTRGLEIDHLWIDSLCIIRDDVADWESESAKMGVPFIKMLRLLLLLALLPILRSPFWPHIKRPMPNHFSCNLNAKMEGSLLLRPGQYWKKIQHLSH